MVFLIYWHARVIKLAIEVLMYNLAIVCQQYPRLLLISAACFGSSWIVFRKIYCTAKYMHGHDPVNRNFVKAYTQTCHECRPAYIRTFHELKWVKMKKKGCGISNIQNIQNFYSAKYFKHFYIQQNGSSSHIKYSTEYNYLQCSIYRRLSLPRSLIGRSKEEKIPLKAYLIVTASLSACKMVRP
jgi:hypothetical protein